MINLPNNWDQVELEYNKHYMPYDYGVYCEECDAVERDMCICEDNSIRSSDCE